MLASFDSWQWLMEGLTVESQMLGICVYETKPLMGEPEDREGSWEMLSSRHDKAVALKYSQ